MVFVSFDNCQSSWQSHGKNLQYKSFTNFELVFAMSSFFFLLWYLHSWFIHESLSIADCSQTAGILPIKTERKIFGDKSNKSDEIRATRKRSRSRTHFPNFFFIPQQKCPGQNKKAINLKIYVWLQKFYELRVTGDRSKKTYYMEVTWYWLSKLASLYGNGRRHI